MSQTKPETGAAAIPGTPLAKRLAALIERNGPLSVHDYMAACLNDPDHGYYRTAQPLGRTGDFITAPEISQVFGELLGVWAASVWQAMGAPQPVALIEVGPGRGTLAADALRAAKALPAFRSALQLHLVETSPVLRAAQEEALGAAAADWHDALESVPDGPAIILANEFLDALPVCQVVWRGGTWRERCVDFTKARGFHFIEGDPAELDAGDLVLLPADAAEGEVAELRPAATAAIAEIARRGTAGPQTALFIDYGHAEAPLGDTLQAVSAHRYAGVFDAPGEYDLTAHVDFRALARAAETAGLRAFGPMPQGRFLLQLGLEARCQRLMQGATPEQRDTIMSGVHRLVDPTQMGALFKAMAITAGHVAPPPPFGDPQ